MFAGVSKLNEVIGSSVSSKSMRLMSLKKKKENVDTDTERQLPCEIKREMEVMHLLAKEHQGLPESTRS